MENQDNSIIVWVSIKKSARLVDKTEKTIRNWIKRGLVEAQFSPTLNRWRVKKSSLLLYTEFK